MLSTLVLNKHYSYHPWYLFKLKDRIKFQLLKSEKQIYSPGVGEDIDGQIDRW